MSRVKTILIAAILVVGILFPTTTLASPEATVSITDATLPTGASGSVELSISTTEPVSCIDVDITYDPAVVEVTSVSGSDFDGLESNIESGHTHLGAWDASLTGLTAGTIKVADITLTRLDGESELALHVITLKGPANNPIPFTVDNGWVTAGGVPPDNIPPTVTATSPADGATGVAITATVRATFSEVIDSGTLAFSVGGVSGTTTYTGTTATFTPGANLGYSRTYTASVSASDLAGNPMAVAYSWSFTTRAPAAGGGGAGGAPAYYIDIDLFGIEESYRISEYGKLRETIEATSADVMVTITVPKGTVALDEDGERLELLVIAVDETPPPPPEDAHVIGLAYSFEPDGASFDPPIELLINYDPEELPENVSSVFIAYYDKEQGWTKLEPIIGFVAAIGTATAQVSHFTTFAVIATVKPPAPAAFTVSKLIISPTEVDIGQSVTITAVVTNTGGETGGCKAVLRIDGVLEVTKEVTISAGASEEVTFTTAKDVAGSYSVEVDGLTGSFTVKEKPAPPEEAPPVKPPINWPVVGGIIAGVVIVGLLIFFLVRRRAY